jgi:hypothetical protein
LLAIILAPLLLSGCASQRDKALRATFVSINVASDGFKIYDADHQAAIVAAAKTKDEGATALAEYRRRREPVLLLFGGAYHALAAAILADDAKSFASLLEVWKQLQLTLDDLRKVK